MKNPFKNSLNIFTKLTLLSAFGCILFFYFSSLIINSKAFSGEDVYTLNILGNLPFSFYLFPNVYKGAFLFLFLTPIFGIIATYKTYKQKKKEVIITMILSIIAMAIIYGNFLL